VIGGRYAPRALLARLALLIVALVVVGFLSQAALERWRLTRYLELLEDDPMRAQLELRRLGTPVLRVLVHELADRFDARERTHAELLRFRLLEELVADHRALALSIAADPATTPQERRMLKTLCADQIELDQLWTLSLHWIERDSPWVHECVYWLSRRHGADAVGFARRRAEGGTAAERDLAAMLLVQHGACAGNHDIIRELASPTEWPHLYPAVIRCLGQEVEPGDLPALEMALLGDDALQRDALAALRGSDLPERVPVLVRTIQRGQGAVRRASIDLLGQILSASLDAGVPAAEVLGPLRLKLESFLDDQDPAIRAGALWLLYPEGLVPSSVAARVTAGVSATDLVDHRLFYFLPRDALRATARELVADPSRQGRSRSRQLLAAVFPPLPAEFLVSLLPDAAPGNRDIVQEALLRLTPAERASLVPELAGLARDDPTLVCTATLQVLALELAHQGAVSPLRQPCEAILDRTIPATSTVSAIRRLDPAMRAAAARLAEAVGDEIGRRVLGQLAGGAGDDEAEDYLRALERLD
jgi:hypothetical protein